MADDPRKLSEESESLPEDTDEGKADQDAADREESEEDPDTVPDGPLHKSERWQKVLAAKKGYEQLGSVEDLRARLTRLEYYDDLAARAQSEARDEAGGRQDEEPLTKEDVEAKKRAKAIRTELDKIAPELAQIPMHGKAFDMYFASVEYRAANETRKLMGEMGLPNDGKDLVDMCRVVRDTIGDDSELYMEYVGDPRTAVREAFKRVTKRYGIGKSDRADLARKQKDKEALRGLPRAHRGGSGSGEGVPRKDEPKNLDEAFARATKKLAAT